MGGGRAPYLLLAAIACAYVATAAWSEGLGYGGDSFSHYLISRYSWQHPELFLHSWGKPFFTLVSSPFTQLGWAGMIAFNVGCGLLTVHITYLYCRTLGMPYSAMSMIFLALMPIHLRQIPTGLTEPLFALIVALSAYLLLIEKFAAACLLISFLPLVRTEGISILPLFLVALVVDGRVTRAPLLMTGLALYSVAGHLMKDDLWWLTTESYGYDTYGRRGSVLHYFKLSPYLFGVPLVFLIIIGLGQLVVRLTMRPRNELDRRALVVTGLLMTGSFCVLFLTYVTTWAMGIFDVIGDRRYMATTASGAVVTAMFGVCWLVGHLGRTTALRTGLVGALCLLAGFSAYRLGGIGTHLGDESVLMRDATRWLKSSGYATEKIYYFNSIVPVELEADPYDPDRMDHLWALRRESPRRGAIVVWDAHYGPNEARLPLANLTTNPDLVLLKSFVPGTPITTFNGYPFEVHIFQKATDREIALYGSD